MVLINGVKYACDRCIRGHRVTTCTHTDQPLTMIKPKGRPASQCHHCRENRKQKSVHVTCTCGKKSKLPRSASSTSINSIHETGCACHKTSHCTCGPSSGVGLPTKKNKETDPAKIRALLDGDILKRSNSLPTRPMPRRLRKQSTPSEIGTASNSGNHSQDHVDFGFISPHETQLENPELSDNFVLEDILMPFEIKKGLFDLFNKSDDPDGSNSALSEGISGVNTHLNNTISPQSNESPTSRAEQAHSNQGSSTFNKERDTSPAGFEVVDPMFPLFPLVGGPSFDTENKPLSGLPANMNDQQIPHQPTPVRPSLATQTTDSNSSLPSATGSSHNINFGSSFDNNPQNGYYNQHSRAPKRPESVLSIASNSSARSFDFMGNNYSNYNSALANGGVPLSSTSTAYPPSGTGTDEFNYIGTDHNEEHNNSNTMHHHFGKTGLGSSKFGSQLSKIESEMYTDSFLDENGFEQYGSEGLNYGDLGEYGNDMQQRPSLPDALSTHPNFYPVDNGSTDEQNSLRNESNGAIGSSVGNTPSKDPSSSQHSKTDSPHSGLIGADLPLFQHFATPLVNTPK
ncbi:HAA1 [Candida theae]|uniref:HAA1 n=1 Tax=Candida theae TaxID=1198502 RepID=A0AAD5BBE8_9ASCO|nr:HAA1 [Candida theae]KAI5949764.1 HAA1 [Candida theae]